jgi:hypothetical protein
MPVQNPFSLQFNGNITEWNSIALGNPTTWGTAATGQVVIGVNAEMFAGTTALSATGSSLNVNITGGTFGGTLSNNTAAPTATNLGVLPALAATAYTTNTYTTGNQVLPVTDLHGALNQDLQAYAGTQLTGTVTAYGTAPTGNVFGVNAFITNTVPVTLTSTTITGTVAVTQSTSPWVVSLASTTITGTVAVTQSTSPWVVDGNLTNNNAAPTATLIGVMDHIAETAYTTVTYTTGDVVLATTDLHGATNVDLQAYGGTQLTGTVTAYGTAPTGNVFGVNAFITNTVPVTLTSTTITGTVAVTQSTSPWIVAGNLTHNNAAPAANNVGVLPAVASTAAPTYTNGDQVLLSTDLAGNLRVTFAAASEENVNVNQWAGTALGTPTNFGTTPGAVIAGSVNASLFAGTTALASTGSSLNVDVTNTVPVTLTSTTITGTVAVTQSTSPWVVSLASTTITGTVAVTQSTSPWVVAGNLTNNNAAPAATNLGVLGFIAETAYTTVTYTTGNQVLAVTDLHGAINNDLQAVAGTAVVTAAAGIQKVGISGATGATMDAVITAATAPANALATLSVYQATQPSLTTGQSVALQNDSAGNIQISYGCNVTTGATLPTALNSVQYITGTATIGTPIGKNAVIIQLDQTTTITAGAVTFEGTYDGINWVTIPVAQVVHPETFALLTNPYTLVASTNQPFMILMQGYQNMRIRVSTAITGTGTVTPYWDSRNVAPLQAINVTANPSGGSNVAAGSIGATKTAIKTSAGAVFGWYFYNSNSSVVYVQMFANTVAGVTLGTTAPTMSLGIPPGSAANMAFDTGVTYATAITIAVTTTRAGATGPTNTVDYNIFYL